MKVLFPMMALLVSCIFGCGNSGDGGSSDGQGPGVDPGTIDDNPKKVTGAFYFESLDKPAAGLELLLADWTALDVKSYPIGSSGAVTIELTEFSEGRTYSFHLASGDLKIADIDLSEVNAGLQSGFEYRGGYGFSLGDVIIPKDNRGIITGVETGLVASVGGGFSLSSDADLKLEDFSPPSIVKSFGIRPSLIVSNARDLYFGLLRPVDPLETARVYGKYHAISLQVDAAVEDSIARAFVSRASDWHAAARVLPAEFADSNESVPWKDTGFYLAQSGLKFFADVLTGDSIVNRIIYLKIEGEEPPQHELLRVVSSGYALPPVVRTIAMNGTAAQAVDFSDPTSENGLTNAFCHVSDDVVATISAPLDLSGAPVKGETLGQIEVVTEYYKQVDGITTVIDGSSLLANPFDSDIEGTDAGDYIWSWQAVRKAMLFDMTGPSLNYTSHAISLPSRLFPSTFGEIDVSRIKVMILFKDKNHPGKSGSVIWIQKDC